ncbi:MAG: MoaD/ThiS family protein [Planctomycetaceae bacterium]|nr:MoaD/ThiS family protein [Planctomycetaceae bacterium]
MNKQSQPSLMEIILEAPLSSLAGKGIVELPVQDGATVASVLQQLAAESPSELKARLLKPDGSPVAGLLLFLNGRPVVAGSAGRTLVEAGDSLLLCPPISGG